MNFKSTGSGLKAPDARMRKRILMTVAGVLLLGVSVGFTKNSNFGTDPFTTCMYGILNFVHAAISPDISYGSMYNAVNLLLLVIMFVTGRHYIGLGTLINIFLLGYVIQGCCAFLSFLVPDPSIAVRIGYLVFGLLLMCFASSLYFVADLGVSTYDFIALGIDERGILKFRVCRIITDCLCVLFGFLLHSAPGIGTIITAFCMGPVIDLFSVHVARPLLDGARS
jgi:Predicted membrane protein